MNKLIAKHRRVVTAIVTVSTAIAMSGAAYIVPMAAHAALTEAQINSILDLLRSFGADQTTVNNVNASLRGQSTIPAPAPSGACNFTRDLYVGGPSGDDVKCLQQYLNSAGYQIAASGAGSAGSETTFFGSLTRAAASKWQSANGVSPAAGYFGALSRAKYNQLVAGAPGTPTPPGVPPVSGGVLQVSKPAQPGDNLAPGNATRIPVTNFTLTAGSADVTVRSITVERVGLATDAAVDKVLLLGSDGLQIGRDKTLGSNHRAILDGQFVIKAGESKTLTVAFNRPAANQSGNVLSFDVVAIDASAPLSGTLPIRGSQITMNTTLSIGSVTLARGINDPATSATATAKNVGDAGVKFSGLRLTAGSEEDLLVRSVAWYQAGSVSAGDLGNVKVILGDTEYPTTIDASGQYYTAKFGTGVTLTKGSSVEMHIKGDFVGGTKRTVEFDLFRDTDLDVVGKQFGFGVKPGGGTATAGSTAHGALSSDTEPAYRGFVAEIGSGSLTVTKSTHSAGAAQNVAVNLDGQVLGAFDVDVKGEAVTSSSLVFRISADSNQSDVTEADYTNIALYDESGSAVAGPKDGADLSTNDVGAVVTFTDAVEFGIGKKTYFLKAKLSTDFDSNTLVSASTTPNSDWTSITGRVSGVTITAANVGTVTGNSMTVKTSASTVSLSNTPTEQTVVRGVTGFTFANVVFDGTASGEDVRFTTVAVQLEAARGADLTNCQLFDGTTALTTGSNVINPSGTDVSADQTFTLDNHLVVPKGTIKSVALKCDVPASGSGNWAQWTLSGNESFGATALVSTNSVSPTVASSSVTNKMNFSASGTLTVALDGSSPAVRLVQAGQQVILSSLRFTATNEAIELKQLALQLTQTASNTPSDLVRLSLWDGATKVGEVEATSSDTGLIASISSFVVPSNSDKVLTVKGLLSPIGVSEVGRPGHLVAVDYDDVNIGGVSATYGTGLSSSQTIRVTSTDTASAGARVVRAYPSITPLPVPTNSLGDASGKILYRFSVSAPAGTNGVSLYRITFAVSTSGDDGASVVNDFSITNWRLYAYANSNFSGAAFAQEQLNQGGLFRAAGNSVAAVVATTSDQTFFFNPASPTSSTPEAIHIPAGSTYYFQLTGDVVGADSGDTASIQLAGDSGWVGYGGSTMNAVNDDGFLAGNDGGKYVWAFQGSHINASTTLRGGAASGTDGNTGATGVGVDFIWTGNSTTTHSGATQDGGPDWYNGFSVPGLSSSGAPAQNFAL